MRSFGAFLTGFAVLLAGCGIKPVQSAGTPDQRCTAISYKVGIAPPIEEGTFGDPLQNAVNAAYDSTALELPGSRADEAVSDSMLFLSGGSEDGAFGAGLLKGWADARSAAFSGSGQRPNGPGLPRFRVVTGISTGALQSTFAFLDDPGEIVERYSIENESELLKPLVKKGLKHGGTGDKLKAGLTVARKGAIARLDPLRVQLGQLVTPALLARVAAEADERRLLVGTVEMDSGEAVVFDLTEAAKRFVERRDPAMRDCYIEALMASSSVPMAALPVFIDGRMYIDGGARFGVLSERLGRLLEGQQRRALHPHKPNLFTLINGTLEPGKKCHLKDCGPDLLPTPVGAVPQHGTWGFDALAFRSLSILINQSYRASVYYADREASKLGFTPHFARIQASAGDWPAQTGLPPEPGATKPCKTWRADDERIDAPLEFHPRYMRCLIDYGKNRPEAKAWAALE